MSTVGVLHAKLPGPGLQACDSAGRDHLAPVNAIQGLPDGPVHLGLVRFGFDGDGDLLALELG